MIANVGSCNSGGVVIRPLRLVTMKKKRTTVRREEAGVTILYERDASTPSRNWLRECVSWLLWCSVPLFIIFYGIDGIQSEHIPAWRSRRERFGDAAVGYSWVVVGIGLWGLGQCCFAKSHRPLFKLLGWLLGGLACGIGIWIQMR